MLLSTKPNRYGRIFQFGNFARTTKRALAEAEEGDAAAARAAAAAAFGGGAGGMGGGAVAVSGGSRAQAKAKAKAARGAAAAAAAAAGVDGDGDAAGMGDGFAMDATTHASLQAEADARFGPACLPGAYVTVYLAAVPLSLVAAHDASRPLLLSAQLRHENKVSVLHFAVRKSSAYGEPVKSKDACTAHVGWRRFACRPSFSQNNLNTDKHKFERYLQVRTTSPARSSLLTSAFSFFYSLTHSLTHSLAPSLLLYMLFPQPPT